MKKTLRLIITTAFISGFLLIFISPFSHEANALGAPSLSMKWINASSDGYPEYSNANKTLTVNPRANTSMPAVVLQFEFSLASGDTAQPGEIEIRIPRYIFQKRTGANEGSVGTLDLPLAPSTGIYGFNYIVSGNDYVIKNYRAFTHSENMVCQMTYNFQPVNVKNGFNKIVGVTAVLTQSGGESVTFSDSIDITVNTIATPPPLSKSFNSKYESWQPVWGNYPGGNNPADYYYIVWHVQTSTLGYIGSQPVTLKLDDVLGNLGGGEIIGVNTSGVNQNYTDKPHGSAAYNTALTMASLTPSPNTHSGNGYSFYILAKYPRDLIAAEPEITNTAYAEATGIDNDTGIPDFEWSVNAKYAYTGIEFRYAGDLFGTTKGTDYALNSSTLGYYNAGGAMNKLNKGETLHLTGRRAFTFAIQASARGYGLTLRNGGSFSNPDDYGYKNYTTELVDDLIFLDNRLLNKDDYSITHCYLAFDEYNWEQNPNSGAITAAVDTDYGSYSEAELWYKTIDGGEVWVKGGTIKRTGASEYEYIGDGDVGGFGSGVYVLDSASIPNISTSSDFGQRISSGDKIPLPEGTYAVKLIHTGSRYEIKMMAYLTMEFYPTTNILEILENKSTSTLLNINSLAVRDSDGAVQNIVGHDTMSTSNYPAAVKSAVMKSDREKYGTIYTNYPNGTTYVNNTDTAVQHSRSTVTLRSVTASTVMTKNAAAVIDDKTNARKTSVQTVNIYESCYYTPSNVSFGELIAAGLLNEQLEGTFYDLLPAGTAFDTFAVKTYGTNIPCEFDYRAIDNWQGSGRTMLIVHAVAPGETNIHFAVPNEINVSYTAYSGFTLTFRLINSYDNIIDNGISAQNLIAYRTASGQLTYGMPADVNTISINGSTIWNQVRGEYSKYFQSLENDPPQRDDGNKNTFYANVTVNFPAPATAVYGITKKVKTQDDIDFDVETQVVPGGLYTYRLRFENSRDGGTSKDVIIYDVLEAEPDGYWKGALESVDISYAESKGISPVVYYSTAGGLDPFNNPIHADLTNADIWSTARPSGNPAAITAVAVDFTLKINGEKQIFGTGESVYCLLNMRAPVNWEEIGDRLAVNRISYSTLYTLNAIEVPTKKESDITKVALRDFIFEIGKKSSPPSGTPEDPIAVNRGNTIEYTVTVRNAGNTAVTGVKITDALPNAITALISNIKYYTGAHAENAVSAAGSNKVSVNSDGQRLTFVINEMYAMETISFIIPAVVANTVPDGTLIINQAAVTEINGAEYNIESEKTYHEVYASLILTGIKAITGKNGASLAGYEFSLTEVTNEKGHQIKNDGLLPNVLTAVSDDTGLFVFDEINNIKIGTYCFMVEETGTVPYNWTFAQPKIVYVTVKNVGGDGTLDKTIEWYTLDETSTDSIFTNIYAPPATGTLILTKTVLGEDTDTDKPFTFTVTFTGDSLNDIESTIFTSGDNGKTWTGTLKDGESTEFSNIPLDTVWVITEDDYTADNYIQSPANGSTDLTGTIKDGDPIKVFVFNAYSPPPPVTGVLRLSKTVEITDLSDVIDYDKMFKFTVIFTGESLNQITSTTAFGTDDGGQTWTGMLKDGENAEFSNIPLGTLYTISEDDYTAENYTLNIAGSGNLTGVINDENTAYADIVNTYAPPGEPPLTETGTLILRKRVEGAEADTEKEFDFTVEFVFENAENIENENIENGGILLNGDELTGNIAEISLSHRQIAKFTNIPYGTSYKISEADYSADNYTPRMANGSDDLIGIIIGAEQISVSVINTYTAPIPPMPAETSAVINLAKRINGVAGANQRFNFILRELNSASAGDYKAGGTTDSTSVTGADTFSFTITGLTAGTYYYQINEISGGASNWTYDSRAMIATVVVTETTETTETIETIETGERASAEVSISGGSDFVNTYTPPYVPPYIPPATTQTTTSEPTTAPAVIPTTGTVTTTAAQTVKEIVPDNVPAANAPEKNTTQPTGTPNEDVINIDIFEDIPQTSIIPLESGIEEVRENETDSGLFDLNYSSEEHTEDIQNNTVPRESYPAASEELPETETDDTSEPDEFIDSDKNNPETGDNMINLYAAIILLILGVATSAMKVKRMKTLI